MNARARANDRPVLGVPAGELVVHGERARPGGQAQHGVGLRAQQLLDRVGGEASQLGAGADDDLHQKYSPRPSSAAPTAPTGTSAGREAHAPGQAHRRQERRRLRLPLELAAHGPQQRLPERADAAADDDEVDVAR